MIRPRNRIQSDFGFIYGLVSNKSIAPDRNRESRVRFDGTDRFTFTALFLLGVTEESLSQKINKVL